MFTTAIVTGRSKDKVYNFVGLDDVFYAGSHGLEIQGPLDRPVKCQVCACLCVCMFFFQSTLTELAGGTNENMSVLSSGIKNANTLYS